MKGKQTNMTSRAKMPAKEMNLGPQHYCQTANHSHATETTDK